jgi:hypothetical protein
VSGPYAEGWAHENPDDPGDRPVQTVELPLVTDELVDRALVASLATVSRRDDRVSAEGMRAALSSVAAELWQAGYNAGFRLGRREGLLGEFKAGPVNTTHQQHETPRPKPEPFA